MKKNKSEKIYIIFSYTGTLFSRFLKIMTLSKYVHISLSFDKELKEVYSFGRKNPRNVFPAGFIKEDIIAITSIYKNTISSVYEINVTKSQKTAIKKDIDNYIKEEQKYRYDILGIPLIFLGKSYNRKYHRVCSQFVGKLLQENYVYNFNKHYSLIKPIDLYKIKDKEIVFQGRLKDYSKE